MAQRNPKAVRFTRQEEQQLTERLDQLKNQGLKITFNGFVREAVREKLRRNIR